MEALAGWEQIALHLSAGSAGSHSSLAVLDGSGTLLSGSDNVLYCFGLDGGLRPRTPTLHASSGRRL